LQFITNYLELYSYEFPQLSDNPSRRRQHDDGMLQAQFSGL
jgi:hypothetical protein